MGKFNLAAAAGYGKMVSKLDTGKQAIQQIPLDKIDPNEENFFQVDDVQDLAESIEVNGILQPLLLVQNGERYRILAGHRRYKAASGLAASGHDKFSSVPAVVLPEMSQAMEQLILIQTNTTARELKSWEKVEAAARLKRTLVKLKAEGVKLPGKLRDIVAEQLEISKTEAARLNVIDQHLSEEWKKELKGDKINASCAYELARLPVEDQQTILETRRDTGEKTCAADVITYVEKKKCEAWLVKDCDLIDGWDASERRKRGQPVECNHYQAILNCKQDLDAHGMKQESCPGCCRECLRKEHCIFCCNAVTRQMAAEKKKEEAQQLASYQPPNQQRWAENFKGSKAEHFRDMLKKLLPNDDIKALDDIAGKWSECYDDMCGFEDDPPAELEGQELYEMMNAKHYDDMGPILDINLFLALCDILNVTPNQMLGYDQSGGWHKYPDTCPAERQQVIIRAVVFKTVRYAEAVYSNGEFFQPEDAEDGIYLYPLKMKTTHWTEVPSKEIS